MQDAVVALQTALDELRLAQEALPDDLQEELRELIAQTRQVLEHVRADPGEADSGPSPG